VVSSFLLPLQVPKSRVTSRSPDLQRCAVSHTKSSGFSLKIVSLVSDDALKRSGDLLRSAHSVRSDRRDYVT
jgi:hypothetical protein